MPRAATIPNSARVTAQRVDQHRTLAHQKIARPLQHDRRLLFRRLDRHEPHRRPCHRLADCFRVGRVVLLAFNIRLHILRRDQPDLMTQRAQLARPIMRRRTGFHAHQHRRQLAEKRDHVAPAQTAADQYRAGIVNAVNLKNLLGEIKSNRANFHRGRLP